MTFYTDHLSTAEVQYYLQHIVAPRPVCFASTTDRSGNVNLSPFSFFNLFSSNPPIVVFSPARRVRDNTVKHTLQNVIDVPEVVINVVTYDMVQQTSLASCDYPKGTDEFLKAGFTRQQAAMVQPPMVKESKAQLECRVVEIKSLGDNGGAGQLVIAEVLCFHMDDQLLTSDKKVMQEKLELVARLGGDWYARISAANLFQVPKPNARLGIGIDSLPIQIRNSHVLTGNHLGQLANVHEIPIPDPAFSDAHLDAIRRAPDAQDRANPVHLYVRQLLDDGNVASAWQVILRMQEVITTTHMRL